LRIPFENTHLLSSLPNEIWSFFFKSGNQGVRIFFTISGFLITTMTLKRWRRLPDLNVKDFYLFRFARIAPSLGFLLVVLTILHFNNAEYYAINPEKASYPRTLFAALTFHINWLEGQVGYLPAAWDILWSLSVEEVFYLFFPFICLLSRKRNTFFLLLSFFIILAPFYRIHTSSNEIWSSKAYLSCMDSIAFGCLTARVIYEKKFSPKALTIAGLLGVTLMVFILLFKRSELMKPIAQLQIDETLLSLATALVLTYCVQASPRKWILVALAPFIAYGKRSYEIYLTHIFVVFWGFDMFKQMNPEDSNRFLILILVVIASGILGYLLERFYSEPLNRLIRAGKR